MSRHVAVIHMVYCTCTHAAAAEISDTAETYQTNVVKLNQQLMEMSLQLSQVQKVESQSASKAQILNAKLAAAVMETTRYEEEIKKLRCEMELLREEAELHDLDTRKADMAQLKLEEVLVERTAWEEERAHLNARVSELERDLDCARENLAEEKSSVPHPLEPASPSSWEEEKGSLMTKILLLEREKCQLASDLEEQSRRAAHAAQLERDAEDAKRDEAVELEILQARISELTQEKCEVEQVVQQLRTQLCRYEGTYVR